MTPVIFRKQDDEIVAVFPSAPANHGNLVCYAHIGQHSECSLQWYHDTKKATPKEYESLLKELVSIGYDDLKIYQKLTFKIRHF